MPHPHIEFLIIIFVFTFGLNLKFDNNDPNTRGTRLVPLNIQSFLWNHLVTKNNQINCYLLANK